MADQTVDSADRAKPEAFADGQFNVEVFAIS